jgi:putative ABC transport system permease protein
MKHWPFLFVLIKSYRNSKFSLAMLMASLVIAAAGLSAVLVINTSAKQSYSSEQKFIVPNVSFTITSNSSKQKLSKQDYAALRLQGFTQVVAVAQTRAHIWANNERISNRRIDFTGIDTFALLSLAAISKPEPLAKQSDSSKNVDEPSSQQSNTLIRQMSFSKPSAVAHPQLLEQLNDERDSKVNSQKATSFTTKTGLPLPTITEFDSPALGNDIIMDIAQLYQLYPSSELSMLLLVGELSNEQQDALKKALPNHLQLIAPSSAEQDSELTKSFHLNLMAMALLMYVVCLFIVVNAVNLLLNSRLTWLKICRQLGISRQQLFIVQLCEIAILTLIASILGVILGLELAKLASPSVQSTLENLYSVELGFGSISILSLFAKVFAICLLGSICATFIPLNKLNNRIAQTKDLPLSKGQQVFWKAMTWSFFAIFALSAYLLLIKAQELWLLLLATALVILSGCCLLLANYASMLRLIQKAIPNRFPLLRVSSKQSIALSGKTKIACCAFFIAATSNIGMNLMVDSFRGATFSWLEQRLVADYYVYHKGEPSLTELAKNTGIKVYQRYENYVTFEGNKIQQFSYPSDRAHQQAMVFYKGEDSKGLWSNFASGKGVLVNQQLAFRLNYDLGDMLALAHPTTGEVSTFEVLGIIYDFGSPYSQVLMPPSMFELSKSKCCMYALQGHESNIDLLREKMIQVGLDPKVQLLKTEELLAVSMQAFDNTFIITDGLNVVTLLVAALSLACAIIVLMNDIRPQNMLIRSMGVSAIKTQLLALYQYLLLCVVALIFATPFGILLSWILIFDINYQAFSWTYPLVIDPFNILQIYATSLLVVTVVIAIPIIQAGRRPLIKDIRWLN